MNKQIIIQFFLILATSLALANCSSNEDSANQIKDEKKIDNFKNKKLCPKIIAKLRECSSKNSIKVRFNFTKLKKWLYEDCQIMSKENLVRYKKFYSCTLKDCSNINSCLRQLQKSRNKN
ncbi:MAG: hypothetical protein PF689_08395 [Deltaproteobacteria bacterium]|jgi:hypothetical protein|nr:hypothetical protein [Deltaproteobacteria bacterium]